MVALVTTAVEAAVIEEMAGAMENNVAVAEVAVAMTLFLKRNRTKWRLLSCFISTELFLIITLQLQR